MNARAELDPRLEAVVLSRRPLLYAEGPDFELDRPPHVRAGSGLAWVGRRLAVVQDDANFLAFFDPETGVTTSLTLPAGHLGKRQFDEGRGNKKWKLDLEACVVLEQDGREVLLGVGSGSTEQRERILVVREPARWRPEMDLVRAGALYARLREDRAFSGSELNVEGATLEGRDLLLFQRGNGAPRDGLEPVNAVCRIEASALLAYLADPERVPCPEVRAVRRWDLGTVRGVRLTFTDADTRGEHVFYLAAAEDSPDTYRDGPVVGVALGIVEGDRARYALIRDAGGAPFVEKAEGLAFDPADPRRAYVVLDRDDPASPSELCVLELRGFP